MRQAGICDFASSYEIFFQLTEDLRSGDTIVVRHSRVECILSTDGRNVLRQLFEDHCKVRNIGDVGPQIMSSDGVLRTHKRIQYRKLMTLYGIITIERLGYGASGHRSLFPKDALLNLPDDLYSHGVRKLVAYEASKSPFNEVVRLVQQITGETIPKHTAEALAGKAAIDFDAFYEQKESSKIRPPLLILTTDGKGIVMRQADLREATRKASELAHHKLNKRQSKGEKAHSKRMAIVAAVYDIERFQRTPEDVVGEMKATLPCPIRPRPVDKRVWASIQEEPKKITEDLFREALRRDPEKKRQWACLVDGDRKQLLRIKAIAKRHKIELTIILDIIHVIEYLWKAAWCFYKEGDRRAEQWVAKRLLAILHGKAVWTAAGMRRSATLKHKSAKDRKPVDTCARYILKNKNHLRYNSYLIDGLPIATGIIEGACRHLIKDRMDVTGARWSLQGAEAILKLRSLRAGDFDEYWKFHEDREYERNHQRLYADSEILDMLRQKGAEERVIPL